MKKKKKGLRRAVVLSGIFFLLVAGILLFYTIREYRPAPVETLEPSKGSRIVSTSESLKIITYNTGYGGLSAGEDFFMDGGRKVSPESKTLVEENLNGISETLKKYPADVYFLQEVDRNSSRSYNIDETAWYEKELGMDGIFACNFKCDFVPYPIPPIGKVDSGIFTMTDLKVDSASRIALAESFSWPVKTCNLKRCMLETRIPLEGTEKELVLINFHLEAYDSGEGKIAQSRMLAKKLEEEYEKGNYVIAGGDFNQTFEGTDTYPIQNEEYWKPGKMEESDLPDHFSFAVDDTYPTCRLLNQPYTGSYEDSQVYVIDGFLVSDNVEVLQCQVQNTEFQYTDHQPVFLEVKFR